MRVGAGDRAVLAAEGGRRHAVAATVVARQEFAGYWEYLLDRAIFTAPAHPFWGGAALIGGDGTLDRHRLAARAAFQRPRAAPRRQHGRADRSVAADPRRHADLRPRRTGRRGRGSAFTPPRSRTRSSSPACPSAGRRAKPGSSPATASSRCATSRYRASPRSGAGSGPAARPAARSCCRWCATRRR